MNALCRGAVQWRGLRMPHRAAVLAFSAALVACLLPVRAEAVVDPPTRAALEQYCVTCHNARLKTGGFVLDTAALDRALDHREAFEKVVRKLRLGVMP